MYDILMGPIRISDITNVTTGGHVRNLEVSRFLSIDVKGCARCTIYGLDEIDFLNLEYFVKKVLRGIKPKRSERLVFSTVTIAIGDTVIKFESNKLDAVISNRFKLFQLSNDKFKITVNDYEIA